MHQSRVSKLEGLDARELGKIISLEDLLTVLREYFSDEGATDVEEKLEDIYNALKFKLEALESIVNAYLEDKLAMPDNKVREMLEEIIRYLMQGGSLSRAKSITDISPLDMGALEKIVRGYSEG